MDPPNHQTRISVLMLPWLAHGHISPFLDLAQALSKRNFHVYLCSTPINHSSIKHRITGEYSRSIQLVELHLPSSPELPPHYHTTNGLPLHLNAALSEAFQSSTESFSNILNTHGPDLVIYDFNQPWAPTIAASYNIPAVQFLTTSAAILCLGFHMFRKPEAEFPFPEIQLSGFHERQLRKNILEAHQRRKVSEKDEPAPEAMKGSRSCLLVKTFRELEGKYLDYLSVLADEKKIVPVGPLVQDIVVDDDEDEHGEVVEWLDKKEESSTVFVSFGSEYFLSKEEMEEVAHGLELSKVNFIWVVRFPMGEKVTVEEALPEGFLDRVGGDRGLVVEGWAPQAKILAHSSTGGFVSHCGWNSVMESIKLGVPVIALPMHLDQPVNARMLEDVGVAVEIQKGEDGRLNRKEIAQVIRKVVVEENGKNVRVKAREISENIRKNGEEEMDEVVEELLQLCKDKRAEERQLH